MSTNFRFIFILSVVLISFSTTSCLNSSSSNNKVTVCRFLDSALHYMDSVPMICEQVRDSMNKEIDCDTDIFFYHDDFTELQQHLCAALNIKYAKEQKVVNIIRLLRYKIKSEIEQKDFQGISKAKLKIIFDSLIQPTYWTNNEKVLNYKWFDSDTLIVLIGQSHSFDRSDNENVNVLKIQSDIFKVSEALFADGIDLFLHEGYTPKEMDICIPRKSSNDMLFQNIEKYFEYNLDSINDIYTYGFEDLALHAVSDSIMKLMLFTEHYIDFDSLNFPVTQEEFKVHLRQSVNHLLDSMPFMEKNLDTSRFYNTIFSRTKDLVKINSSDIFELWKNLSIESNKIILNKRNESTLSTTLNIMKRLNRNVAVIKIGNNHLNSSSFGNIRSQFSPHLVTIQELCEQREISYLYILTENDVRSLIPVK